MKLLVELLYFLTASTPIPPDHGITSDLSLSNCEILAYLSRNYLASYIPQKRPYLAYMTHTESEFSFNIELAIKKP